MAEPEYRRKAPAAGKPPYAPWAAALVVLVAAAFVAGWRSRRGWGRLTGY
jgi:hypothetical protein